MSESPTFFGADTDQDECDRIYVRLPSNLRENDTYLYGKKWFDYRFEHDVLSTYRFVDAYNAAYVDCYKRFIHHDPGPNLRGVDPKVIFDKEKKSSHALTGAWKARQWADAFTMPYDAYCRIALSWAVRRQRKFLPRMFQLYGFDLLTAIQETWLEEQKARLFVAADERYKNQVYAGHPVQNAHHEWLLEQASLRVNPAPMLARVLYRDNVLLESKVEARFGRDMLEQARAFS